MLLRSAYGRGPLSDASTKDELHSRFSLGRIAEQFVAAAVLQLKEQGKIKLDASVCSYLSNCPAVWSGIQVVHLLTHTSGLPSVAQSPRPQPNSASKENLQSLLEALGQQPLEFKPGSRFEYNELNFTILSHVIERVSGRSSRNYIETHVFDPARMTETGYRAAEKPRASVGKANIRDGASGTGTAESPLRHEAVYSTLEDIYRWNRALSKGEIISQASVLEMFTPYRDGHGLGWKINREFDRRLALQNGVSGEMSVSVRLYPDDDVLVILVGRGIQVDATRFTHDLAAIALGMDHPPVEVSGCGQSLCDR